MSKHPSFFQAEDGIRDLVRSRGLGDVYKRQGKESAKKDNSKLKLTPLIIETKDIDVTNNEAVVKDGKSIGYITSGGFAHHVKKSVAYSYLDKEILKTNEKFQVEINGNFYNSTIIKEPLYDPRGTKMRS